MVGLNTQYVQILNERERAIWKVGCPDLGSHLGSPEGLSYGTSYIMVLEVCDSYSLVLWGYW